MKEEALKLADELQDYMTSLGWKTHQAPDMIRRLVEELDKPHKYDPETGEPLIDGYPLFSGLPRQKPLSDEEIWEWFEKNTALTKESALMIARAIEERHRIK